MFSIEDMVADAECLRDLLAEHIDNLRHVRANPHSLDHPLVASDPSSARNSSQYEAEDVLPVGRLKHAAYGRMSAEEGLAFTVGVLTKVETWLVPLKYAEQHFSSHAAVRYYYGLLTKYCAQLYREGRVDRRDAAQRGYRYSYRLRGLREPAA